MKTVIHYLFVMIIVTLEIKATDFNIMPININFYGAVISGKNIIAYGDFGSYMMTTDKGKSWKQYSLNDYGIIVKMINYNDTLWCILREGYILRSLDNGFTWKTHNLGLDTNQTVLHSMAVSDDYIFIRTDSSIMRFDKDFQFINSITDTLLTDKDKKLYYLKGYLIINSYQKYKDGFIRIPDDLSVVEKYFMRDKIYIWIPKGKTDSYCRIEDIFKYKDSLVFHINDNLYKTDIQLSKWGYFYPDTTFLNNSDSLYNRKWNAFEYITNDYYFNNSDLYLGYKRDNWKKMLPASSVSFKSPGDMDYYGIKKFQYLGDSCVFEPYKNPFDMKYYCPKENDLSPVPIASATKNDFAILEDSIIVVAGPFKSIFQTRDDCKSWELVTALAGDPKLIMNNNTYISLRDGYNNNDFYITRDFGVTYMPTELELNTKLRILSKKDSTGMLHVDTLGTDTVSYFSYFLKTGVFYMDSLGRGFWSGVLNDNMSGGPNFAYTNDWGKRYKFIKLSKINESWLGNQTVPCQSSNVIESNHSYIFASVYNIRNKTDGSIKYYNYLWNISSLTDEEKMQESKMIKRDSLYFIQHIFDVSGERFKMFVTVQDSINTYDKWLEVWETSDGGLTTKSIFKFDKQVEIKQVYEYNRDSLFLSCDYPNSIYLYDSKLNQLNVIYESTVSANPLLMRLGGMFYIVGKELFLVSTDMNDLTKWQPAKWDYGTPTFESVIFKGDVALAKFSDSLRQLNNYRITTKNFTGVQEANTELKYHNTQFYASPPWPIPASNLVTTRITWDMSFGLKESIVGIFNVYGERVEGSENITIDAREKCIAILSWDCCSAPGGLYFIVVRHNGLTDCIPVIVKK